MPSASVEKSQIQEERLDDENHASCWDLSLNTLKTKTLSHCEHDSDWTFPFAAPLSDMVPLCSGLLQPCCLLVNGVSISRIPLPHPNVSLPLP